MQTPSIAVIVPNYNDVRFLRRSLLSVLEQPTGPNELVVVDDHSSDDSVSVIQGLIAGDARAQLVINPRNLGTNGALNEGLARIRSDYVVFLAANDFLLPGIFARARACLGRWPNAGVWSAMAWLVDEEDRRIRLHPSAVVALRDSYLSPECCIGLARRFGNWFTGTTLIYRREALAAVGGFDPDFGAPSDLFTALTIASLRGAAFSPAPFAAIRMHRGSYSSATLQDPDRIGRILGLLKERGSRRAPRLFDAPMLERTAQRFWFAAVRATGGLSIPQIVPRLSGWRKEALSMVGRLYPALPGAPIVALAFLVLRPYDLMPTLWYRGGGWLYVRIRLLLARRDEV